MRQILQDEVPPMNKAKSDSKEVAVSVLTNAKKLQLTAYKSILHWMKVEQGMEFKLCLLIYKALNDLAPPYISEHITFNNIGRRGTSSPHVPLFMESPPELLNSCPSLWNKLPLHIKTAKDVVTFKISLKMYLFKISCND
jgi:hypothetical protein